jgi:prepilin-type N-terminal cleavage/methylation domain-containing protein
MNKKGFTLIELLVVIAIIGMLSALAVVSLNTARDKAKDAQIQSDLSQFRTYMTVEYPDGDFTGIAVGSDDTASQVSQTTPPLTHPGTGAAALGNYVIASNGTNTAWIATGQLIASPTDSTFCVDSDGNAVTILNTAVAAALAAFACQ